MGSWNGTCGLTSLPIRAGDRVYVFPIIENRYEHHSLCYSTALYEPFLIPFEAQYNNYGAGENETGVSLPLIIAAIKERLVEMEQGENQFHDIPVKRINFDKELFWEAIHEQRLLFGNAKRHVYFTMVRKDIVDRLWDEWILEHHTFTDGKFHRSNYTYAAIAKDIPAYLQTSVEEYSEFSITSMFKLRDNSLVSRNFWELEESHRFWHLVNVSRAVFQLAALDSHPVAVTLMEYALRGLMVDALMEYTRKVWLPMMHGGSGSQKYSEYRLLNRLTEDVIKGCVRRRA